MSELVVDRINLNIGQNKILTDVSFKVRTGSVHGLLGPNGAGKSSTFKAITQISKIESGQILYGDKPLELSDIGFTIEEPILIDDLSVSEFLLYLAKLRNCVNPLDLVNKTLEKCRLNSVMNKPLVHLSTGYKQRVAIAQAILHNPPIVILDEPTNGLDPQSKIDMRNLIIELKQDHTILVSSHLLLEMGQICDDITILSQGKVITTGPLAELEDKMNSIKRLSIEFEGSGEDFVDFLNQKSYVKELVEKENGKLSIIVDSFEDKRHEIIKNSFQFDIRLNEIFYEHKNLEDVFLEVTDKL